MRIARNNSHKTLKFFINHIEHGFMFVLRLDSTVEAWTHGQGIKLVRTETILAGQDTP